MAGIEWAEQGNQRGDDGLTPREFAKIEAQLFAGRAKIQNRVFRQGRRQGIGVTMVESKRESMKSIRDFVPIGRELGEFVAHCWDCNCGPWKSQRSNSVFGVRCVLAPHSKKHRRLEQ